MRSEKCARKAAQSVKVARPGSPRPYGSEPPCTRPPAAAFRIGARRRHRRRCRRLHQQSIDPPLKPTTSVPVRPAAGRDPSRSVLRESSQQGPDEVPIIATENLTTVVTTFRPWRTHQVLRRLISAQSYLPPIPSNPPSFHQHHHTPISTTTVTNVPATILDLLVQLVKIQITNPKSRRHNRQAGVEQSRTIRWSFHDPSSPISWAYTASDATFQLGVPALLAAALAAGSASIATSAPSWRRPVSAATVPIRPPAWPACASISATKLSNPPPGRYPHRSRRSR
jgi:hypothetical protein